MSFRARMVLAVTLFTLLTLGVAFAVISVAVHRSQEQHLDTALLRVAQREAAWASQFDLADPARVIPGDPGAHQIGRLPKFRAIYDEDGRVLAATSTFKGIPAVFDRRRHVAGSCFDFYSDDEHLRAIFVGIPKRGAAMLLMAVPRTDLDEDAVFLRRAMTLVFAVAVAWTMVVASWIVHRLTWAQRRMALVARRVAAGDLSARVGPTLLEGDEMQLARDLDDMIARLSDLLDAQRIFVAHAAHELRSPLAALYGELSLALRRSREVVEYRQAIKDALASTRQLKELAEDLLAVARLGVPVAGGGEPVNVRAVLKAVVAMVSSSGNSSQVHLEIEGSCAPALASTQDVVRLFRNLVENAIRHSPPDGTVRLSMVDYRGSVMVTVSDQGPGVAEQDKPRIFSAFYRGTSVPTVSGAEVGLGLTIARSIARAYGGDVVLDDDNDGGSRFKVTLPAAAAADSPGAPADAASAVFVE